MEKLINDFSVGLFFWQSLLFIALILLLKKFAWGPILSAVEEREEGIKEALELADRVLMGPGGKKIDAYVLREALGKQKRLCSGYDKETGEKLYRPAVKLSK